MSKYLGIGVVALCLALAGCGGSGGGEPTVNQSVHDMLQEELDDALALLMETQTARDTARTQLVAARADVTRLTGELATANTSLGSLTDELATAKSSVTSLTADLSTAQAEVTRLTTQIGSATEATSLQGMLTAANAEVTRLTSDLATANTRITTLTGQLTVAQSETESLRRQLADARTDVTEAEQRATQAETDAQSQIAEAERRGNITLRAPEWVEALDLSDAAAQRETGVIVEHMRGMTRKVAPTGNYSRGSAPPSVSGFSGAGFTRQRGTVGTETLRLYTNLGSPGSRQWWKVYGAADIANVTTDAGKARPSSFGISRSLFQVVQADMTVVPENRDDVTRSGMYDGVSGTFSCDTGCNMAADADGMVTYTGTWTFKPGSLTSGISQDQDTEFLYFGDWAFEPTNPVDADPNAHAYKWIAGGDAGAITQFDPLEGTATFNGGAVGRYVLRNQVGQGDRVGSFSASASFTANFDTNMIDGRLEDFREGGTSLSGWSVYLGGSASGPVTLAATGVTGGVATASIGGVAATGAWAASLHGTDNPGYNGFDNPGAGTTTCPVSTGCPAADLSGIAGWFDAGSATTFANSDAAIAGTFAAAD